MTVRIFNMDCRAGLALIPTASVHCVVTSPPYFGLRDYGVDGQMGLEPTPQEFVAALVDLFREIRRVLRDDGTVWLNLGDSYAGSGRGGNPTEATSTLQGSQDGQKASMVRRTRGQGEIAGTQRDQALTNVARRTFRENLKVARAAGNERPRTSGAPAPAGLKQKDLIGIPWRVAFALQDDGWWLRQEIIWSKPNPMPESVTDRCTKAHESLFLLSKAETYFFDQDAITEPIAAASIARLAQNIDDQVGSVKANGGVRADRPFKAASRKSGNLERKPPASRGYPDGGTANQAGSVPWEGTMRNRRSVWEVATTPFQGEYCSACHTYFEGQRLAALFTRKVPIPGTGQKKRIRYCTCGRTDAWVAHFATFPADLITPCIKAGCSEYGACADCGAPWTRVVSKKLVPTYKVSHGTVPDARDFQENGGMDQGSNRVSEGHVPGMAKQVTTLGFVPTCRCGQTKRVNCTVLDPFGGAGTTGLVADRMGRDAVLFELNSDYADMARQRIGHDAGMFGEVELVAPAAEVA